MSQHIDRLNCKRLAANLGLLAYTALFCLSIAGDGLAFERRRAPAPGPLRPAAAKPFAPNFGRNVSPVSPGIAGPAQRPLDHAAEPQHPLEHGPGLRGEAAAQNRSNQEHAIPGRPSQPERGEAGLARNPAGAPRGLPGNGGFRNGGLPGGFRNGGVPGGFRNGGLPAGFARNGLPQRPFPGETGFTGVPPRGETRFVSNEMVFHASANVSAQAVDAAARRLGLVAVSSQNLTLSGGTLFHFRIDNGRQVSDVVRELEAENIGVAQPNYIYRLQQDTHAPLALPPLPRGDPSQYVVSKLRLPEVHKIATGANVLVAMIDSQVDSAHPDLSGSFAGQFDAVGNRDKPDEHGTEMTGAIVAHRKLLGVAPRARILAIHSFSPEASAASNAAQTTTEHILAGIEWAIAKGARIINMSFAGPYDPVLSLALKKAHEKGIVLIAAAGNAGPQSPPLYPAADENVIAVTAVDENDKLLPQANQGPHVALSAPGVNVLETAPNASYEFTTGTSVATAHVSGVAALIIERDPMIDVAALEELLYSTARDLGPKGRDSQFGYGLVDPLRALDALEAKVAMDNAPPPAATPPLPRPFPVSATSGMTVSQVPLAPGPGATNADTDHAPLAEKKRLAACAQDGTTKGMRGPELRDYTVICLAEARLTCLKQAAAQKVRGPDRKDFMGKCLGS
jgi:Subtilase family